MDYLTVGEIVNTHGIRGEVKVFPRTDFSEQRFVKGNKLLIEFQGELIESTIHTARQHKNVYIILLDGYQNINEVEKFKGCLVMVPASDKIELDTDEYYVFEIVGCSVVTDQGEEIGTITEVLKPGANDVWVAERKNKQPVYIPVIDDVVLKVDIKDKIIVIDPMEGML